MSKIIGIDLGTTNSAVAVVEGGKPKIIHSAEGENIIPSVVDPKPCNYADIWAGCTVALPNSREMDEMILDAQNLVVTHGSGGVVLTSKSGAAAIPCREVDNPQVVGAGDAFTAGMASALAQDSDIMKAAEFAVEFATDYVSWPRAEIYSRRYEYASSQ